MNIFDTSMPIRSDMPVWPGDPSVTLSQLSAINEGASANTSQIQMCVHTGTHIDAPKHFLDNGKTIDQIPLEKLVGEAIVLTIEDQEDVISAAVLQKHPDSKFLSTTRKVLFKTSNSKRLHTDPTTFYQDYVGIDTSGAEFLSQFDLDLIGVDYYSVATFNETRAPHQIFLRQEIVLLEGIDLTDVSGGLYRIICLPLNIAGCEGAPARVILTSEA